ncbi:MAG: branched-chain amino acid transaminase [Nitrosopumilus sp.]|nr:branched-chain amino acid transaminase [Candidatus Hydrogenedentota bacterium]MCH8085768.1 branched-chain amino acid transaminase [Nitrososphaerota archaeon]
MKETGKIWMNGKLVPFKDAKVHVLTHALHYSTSIFEGIRCYNTPNGSAIFRLPEHVDRLFKSAKLYSMKMQFSKKEISEAIVKTVKASRLKECYIRPLAYYGYGTMGLTPTPNKVDVSIACWAWKMGESKAGKFSGAKCQISSWVKIDSRSQPMQAKAAANYSNAALARMEALENGYDEAIMLNSQGKISEGSAENIFIIKDDIIQTPPLSAGLLEGITRDSVIQIIEENGGFVIERDLERDYLYTADEIFMTGTAAEVKSVTQIDKVKIGNGKMGIITKALQKSFSDVVMGKDERFLSWLTFI